MRSRPVIPAEIDCSAPGEVAVRWRDGRCDRYHARSLRIACPCAHCVHELTGERILDPAAVPADIRALAAAAIGNYATKFAWSDGHSTGLYTHALLRKLGDAAR